jgi:hypothetical protein
MTERVISTGEVKPGDCLNIDGARVTVTSIRRVGTVYEVRGEYLQLFAAQPWEEGRIRYPATTTRRPQTAAAGTRPSRPVAG